MTTVPPVTMNRKDSVSTKSEENITVRGKFKSVDLFNNTIHIILYPDDGLRAAARLQEIEQGTDLTLNVRL